MSDNCEIRQNAEVCLHVDQSDALASACAVTIVSYHTTDAYSLALTISYLGRNQFV